MRVRKSKIELVASTNFIKHQKILAISGKRNTVKTILIGERVGRTRTAVLECSSIRDKSVREAGSFDCITNKSRIDEKLLTKMVAKLS